MSIYTDVVGGLFARWADEPDRPADPDRVLSTGLRDLDDILAGGLRTGQVCVLTGPTGAGKSTLALHLTRQVAIHQRTATLLYAPETPSTEIGLRIVAAETRVRHQALRAGAVDERMQQTIEEKRQILTTAPLSVVSDRPGSIPPDELLGDIAYLASSPRLRLVVIDGLSHISQVGDTIYELAALARSGHFAIVITCPESALHTLVETVDLVIRVGPADLGTVDVEVVKHRYGPTGTVEIGVHKHYANFADLPSDA